MQFHNLCTRDRRHEYFHYVAYDMINNLLFLMYNKILSYFHIKFFSSYLKIRYFFKNIEI